MKKPSRFLRVLGAAGLLISLLAATIAPVAAQQDEDDLPNLDGLEALFDVANAGFRTGDNAIYYPWVANGENFGLGPSQTSISVQNLEDRSTTIAIFVGNGDGFDLETTAFLSPFAAKTFSAGQLNIEEGSGAPVAVLSFQINEADLLFPNVVAGSILTETVVLLSKPDNVTGDFTQVNACVVNASSATSNPGFGVPVGFVVAAPFEFDVDGDGVIQADEEFVTSDDDDDTDENSVYIDAFTQEDLQDILEDANSGGGDLVNPFGGLINDADCNDVRVAGRVGGQVGTPGGSSSLDSVAIGGVAKQTAEAGGDDDGDDDGDDNGDDDTETQQIVTTDTAVSGYNALNGAEVSRFDQWYLPIVQTNCGPGGCWNSILRVANITNENSAVTVRFFPHDDAQGSLDTGFQVQELVDAGETIDIDLSSLVPEGYIGSAHILTDGRVVTMVDRYKVGYNMWITNSGSSADFENLAQVPGANGRFALFAPHVLLDYFGWNTGINVANLVDEDNNVSIQYFNLLGNATQVLNQRIAAHGMTYFYDPSQAPQDGNVQDVTTDPNAGVVGSAIIWSDSPVAAAIDATKYPESDPNGGEDVFQATSYSATANVFTFQAVPLVQKGNPIDGSGATSGINIMNPNSEAVTANVFFVNPSGFLADNFGTSSVTIPGFANGFVYTLWQANLPNGFTGAAQVVASAPVAAVSANVNYDVDGDGSAIFNAFNPCGFFRVAGECDFGPVFTPGGQSVTKTFIVDDEDGEDEDTIADDAEGVAGVNFTIVRTDGGAPYTATSVSGTDGSRTFNNVPVGTYELFVNSVPGSFVQPVGAVDTFAVTEGSNVELINELTFNQALTKTVCIAERDEDADIDDEFPFVCDADNDGADDIDESINLAGVNVTIFEIIGTDFLDFPVTSTEIVFEGETGDDGTVTVLLAPGDYLLCLTDGDGEATTVDGGETVNPLLPETIDATILCDFGLLGGDSPFGEIFEIEAGMDLELDNPVFIENGVINIFVGTEDDVVVLDQSVSEDFNPVGGVEVCVYSDDTGDNECAVSDEDGTLSFIVEGSDEPWFPFDAEAAAANRTPEGFGGDNGGLYFAEIFSDDYSCADVDGGELTAEILDEDCFFENRSEITTEGLQQEQQQIGEFDFYYDPTADVEQDGYLDDEVSEDGTFDIVIEVVPLPEGV